MDEPTCYGTVLGEGAMNEYPPQNPPGDIVVPTPPGPHDLAVTGADIWLYLGIAGLLIALGMIMIFYVGKKSDSHHKDD
jgi:hypothetical protein